MPWVSEAAPIEPEAWERLPRFIQEDARILRSRVKEPSAWDAAKNEAEHEANRPYWLKPSEWK